MSPALAYNFEIRLGGGPAAGFSECSGLGLTLQVEEYREGGRNDTVLRFPTRATWTNVKLRRGLAASDELWNWHAGFVAGRGQRRNGVIVLLDDRRTPLKTWGFTRGIPVRWTGPTLDAAQSRVAIEELEIAHEGLELL